MALLEINWHPDRRELKQFAVLWVGIFSLIGVDCWLRRGALSAAAVFGAIAAAGVVGYFRPGFLRPVYIAWMAVAWPIGWTVSHLVLTPIGLLMRLFGYDPLNRRFDRSAESYWTPHDPGADASRYFKQF
jgi:hypothetical protein